jgi:hypothetical protein
MRWLVLASLVACGKATPKPPPVARDARAVAAIDAAIARASADATTTPALFATSSSPHVRALGVALEAIDHAAFVRWQQDASQPRGGLAADPPGSALFAIGALVAWDSDGSPVRIECGVDERGLLKLRDLADVALARATAAEAPALHAVMHLARELRQSETSRLAIGTGLALATKTARWFADHRAHMPDALVALAPEDDVPMRAARAEARCAIAHVDASNTTLLAVWRETQRQLVAARSVAAITRVIEKRGREAPAEARLTPVTAEIEALAAYRELAR